MNIYLDLDGTILDVSNRYYQIYFAVVGELGGYCLFPLKYWRLKRAMTLEKDIAHLSLVKNIDLYIKRRIEIIEQESYLKLDRLVPGATSILKNLKNNHRLVLVTLRKKRKFLNRQLCKLSLDNFFSKILISEEGDFGWNQKPGLFKATLIRRDSKFSRKDSVIVGDTGEDIMAGRNLKIITIAVSSGLRNQKCLSRYEPDYLIRDLRQLPKKLESIKLK